MQVKMLHIGSMESWFEEFQESGLEYCSSFMIFFHFDLDLFPLNWKFAHSVVFGSK